MEEVKGKKRNMKQLHKNIWDSIKLFMRNKSNLAPKTLKTYQTVLKQFALTKFPLNSNGLKHYQTHLEEVHL